MKSRHPAVELPDYKSLNCDQSGDSPPVTASQLFHCSSGHFVPLQNTTARWWRRAASKQEDCMEIFKDTSRLQFPPIVTSQIIQKCKSIYLFKCGAYTKDNVDMLAFSSLSLIFFKYFRCWNHTNIISDGLYFFCYYISVCHPVGYCWSVIKSPFSTAGPFSFTRDLKNKNSKSPGRKNFQGHTRGGVSFQRFKVVLKKQTNITGTMLKNFAVKCWVHTETDS